MSWNKGTELPPDLSERLSALVELDRPKLVAPRRPMDREITSPDPLPPLLDVEMHVGSMYVLAEAHGGPRFVTATWLRPNRRTEG